MPVDWSLSLGFLAATLALVLAAVVLAIGRETRSGRLLALILAIEGLFQLSFTLSELAPTEAAEQSLVGLAFVATYGLAAVYPWILRDLDTPVTGLFRRRGFMLPYTVLVSAAAVGFAALFLPQTMRGVPVPEDSAVSLLAAPAFLLLMVLSIWALVAAISAFRRAPAGPRKERARAFALAFGARDGLFVLAIGLNFASDSVGELLRERVLVWSSVLNNLGTLVYVPVLAYGILKTQLFDLDLKVKLGIKRSTVVTIVLVVILGTAKTAEFYLNKTYGLLAGGIAAGAMLVLTPRLNKMGDKVANAALPQVQPTSAYLSFKKLEVYRAAVESAYEVGMDDKQRAVLERLRTKLALAPSDTAAIEAELASPVPA
jgi:hypothetical protein